MRFVVDYAIAFETTRESLTLIALRENRGRALNGLRCLTKQQCKTCVWILNHKVDCLLAALLSAHRIAAAVILLRTFLLFELSCRLHIELSTVGFQIFQRQLIQIALADVTN